MIPIVLLCRDRVRYLDTTLKSLSASVPAGTPLLLVNDATKNLAMTQYLTTNEEVIVNEPPFPNGHPGWQTHVGTLPNSVRVRGIKGKAEIQFCESAGGTMNLGRAVAQVFDTTGAPFVIRVEDDVVFVGDWYRQLCDALGQVDRLGLLSGFRYFFRQTKRCRLNLGVEELQSGFTGGCMLAVSRSFYERRRQVFVNAIPSMKDNDVLWGQGCRAAKLRSCVTMQSLCQHIGVISNFSSPSHKQFFVRGKLAKIALDVTPPFEIADQVRSFGVLDANTKAE